MKRGQLLAGGLGGFLGAVAGTVCIALHLQIGERDRILVAGLAFIPLWLAALFLAGTSSTTKGAWSRIGLWLLLFTGLALIKTHGPLS